MTADTMLLHAIDVELCARLYLEDSTPDAALAPAVPPAPRFRLLRFLRSADQQPNGTDALMLQALRTHPKLRALVLSIATADAQQDGGAA